MLFLATQTPAPFRPDLVPAILKWIDSIPPEDWQNFAPLEATQAGYLRAWSTTATYWVVSADRVMVAHDDDDAEEE